MIRVNMHLCVDYLFRDDVNHWVNLYVMHWLDAIIEISSNNFASSIDKLDWGDWTKIALMFKLIKLKPQSPSISTILWRSEGSLSIVDSEKLFKERKLLIFIVTFFSSICLSDCVFPCFIIYHCFSSTENLSMWPFPSQNGLKM